MKGTKRLTLMSAMFCLDILAGPALAQEESYVLDVGGIAMALNESQRTIGRDTLPALKPVNKFQQNLIPYVEQYNAEMRQHMKSEELNVFASFDPEKINAALKKAGSRLRVDFTPPREFGVVSILNVSPQFAVPGELGVKDSKTGNMTYFSIDGRPAFRMTVGEHQIDFKRLPGSSEPLIVLNAKNGDQILLWKSDRGAGDLHIKEGFAAAMLHAARNGDSVSGRYLGAVIPMVDLDQEVDISQLKGLEYAGTDWYVSEAKQQIRFLMDPNGVTVKSETVIVNTGRSLSIGPSYYDLTGSFYAVVVRPGMSVPYFSGFIGTEDRKIPASYESKLPEAYPFK